MRKRLRGAQWLSGRVLDSRPKGRGFEPHRRHCVVSLSKNINPSLVLVQPRKTRPFITERLLMGRKESNQTNKQTNKDSDEPAQVCFLNTALMAQASMSSITAFMLNRLIEEFPIIGFYLYHVTSLGQSSNWTTSGI